MTDTDRFWLDKCEEFPQKYIVYVDNDEVYVADMDTDEEVYTFTVYGWRFALGLLRYIGCNAEEV